MNDAVLGIGIDLVENARIRESLEKFGDRFKRRIYLPAEQAYCDAKADPVLHYACRFAAKEAVSKAFGTGIGAALGWCDIEIVKREGSGEPLVHLHGGGGELLKARGASRVLVSLTHTKDYSAAQAVLLRKQETGNS